MMYKDGQFLRVADGDDADCLTVLGASSSEEYAESDALADVATGKASRVYVVKVICTAERTAKIAGRK
jgi:hypothetical protein